MGTCTGSGTSRVAEEVLSLFIVKVYRAAAQATHDMVQKKVE